MKSKKFVLAGLVLLAITGLLALTSCKNDTVSETPAAKLVSISVTPPERTVYSVGQEFDPTGMVVTATYDDKSQQEVTGWTTNFDTVATKKGLGKEVTVSYTERDTTKEATFTVDVASYQFTETVQDVDSSLTGGIYKKFGDWPQTIKDKDVTVGKNTMTRGGMDFHVGSDGNYYVEAEEKANGSGTAYKYSNGDQVGQGGTSTKWFKVEPIVWRVLTQDYKDPEGKSTGNALLLAESILTGGIRYYVDSTKRTITKETVTGTETETETVTVYANNWQYSTIRAWLNGLDVVKSDDTLENDKTYTNNGFLQTAFTADAQSLIADTTVDNSAASTTDVTGRLPPATVFACGKTTDKVFLLSEAEATTGGYGFATYNNAGSTRIRVTTDYAKATGADQSSPGGWWWLRSPDYRGESFARYIRDDGRADSDNIRSVSDSKGGVVPALSISLTEN